MKTRILARLSTIAVFMAFAVVFSFPGYRANASTFNVTRTADDARAGSLRFAIGQANSTAGTDDITFTLTGGTVITLSSNLPAITEAVHLNGYSQSGTTQNTLLTDGSNATPTVELVPAAAAGVTIGLNVTGTNSIIRGLVMHGFPTAIRLAGTGNAVGGCFIGTNPAGTGLASSTNGTGISITADTNAVGGTTIGNTGTENVNVISGNTTAGILISGVTGGATILGNVIGTNALATAQVANGVGVQTSNSSLVLVGSSNFGQGNIISGNTTDGIQVTGGSSLFVRGNLVGLGADGQTPVPNLGAGINIAGADTATVGGSALERNVISSNGGDGLILEGCDGALVTSNFIGTDTGETLNRGNGGSGIVLTSTTNSKIGNLGGTGNPIANTIVGNAGDGITTGGTSVAQSQGNDILCNFIGLTSLGNALPNAGSGILVGDETTTTKIGDAGNARNYISGNGGAGITIEAAATTTTILNNYIGTDSNGTASLPNGTDGVNISGSAGTLGDNTTAGRNLISGNPGTGVVISGPNNNLLGNIIGLNAAATGPLSNGDGVTITGTAATNNVVGGGATRNVISCNNSRNKGYAIYINGGADSNFVYGNLVGTNGAGTAVVLATGSTRSNNRGIIIEDSSLNTVGGVATLLKNVVAGSEFGVGISGAAGKTNTIVGNRIGTDLNATLVMPNDYGVGLAAGANDNLIGGDNGTTPGTGNIISGNVNNNIYFNNATNNSILGNMLGTRADGKTPLGNVTTSSSIGMDGGSTNNVIGDTGGFRNVISGVAGNGIYFQDPTTTGNSVVGNYIGVGSDGTTSVPNGGSGVVLANGASDNFIGTARAIEGNVIANNAGDGVAIYALTTAGTEAGGNSIRWNSIFNNGGLGINLRAAGEGADVTNANDAGDTDAGPNGLQNSPTLSVVNSGSNVIVTAALDAVRNFDYIIDLYRSTGPTAASVEGQTYVASGASSTDASGKLTRSFTVPAAGGSFFTATTVANGSGSGVRVNDTSEFSPAVRAAAAPSLVVTTTADSGAGSLRQAITNANLGTGNQTITFNIPAGQASGGVWTIHPTTALPALTAGNVTVDAGTQTSFGGNTNPLGPEVVLAGPGGATGFPGLSITGSNNIVTGLVINNFIGSGQPNGIRISGSATGNHILGCYIGTDKSGAAAAPNEYGVVVTGTAHDNLIGGLTVAQSNTIAFNNANGILISSTGRGNAVLGNKVFSNGAPRNSLGLDLSLSAATGDGITANDNGTPPSVAPDGDTGPNNLQNFPNLSVTYSGGTASITGSLLSTPGTSFRIEYFESATRNGLGNGEGQTLLGTQTVTTDATGSATNLTLSAAVPAGHYITATATRTVAPMDTSEFSPAVQAVASVVTPAPTADYRFANSFVSSVGTPPALTKLGTGGFATEFVGSATQKTVYRFDDNCGLQLAPAMPTLGNGAYTLALIARLDATNGYNRLVDLRNAASDSGFYVRDQRLNLYPDGSGAAALIENDFFYQWVFTRTPAGLTRGYVNGVLVFTFNDTNGDGALSAANVLRLFRDDNVVGNEASSGAISRFRVWNVTLTADQVAALDGNPVYTSALTMTVNPTTIAENAGAGAATVTVSRSGPTGKAQAVQLKSSDLTEAKVASPATVVLAQGVKTANFTIDAVDDTVTDGPQIVTLTASGSGLASVNKTLIVTDNDTGSIIVTATPPLTTGEDGSSDMFKVRLSARPATNVVIPLRSSDTGEGTVLPGSLTFTPANWNVDQTVTVAGVDDSVVDGDQPYTIQLLAATGDPGYAGQDAPDINAINRDNDGSTGLLAWGYNEFGQIGDGTRNHSSRPVQVGGYGSPSLVAAGGGHSVAAANGGTARAAGYNAAGQLGDNTKVDKTSPVGVNGLSGVKALAAGWYHSLALLNDGTVWAWGYNASGELGDGTTVDRSQPVKVTGLTGVVAIAAGTYHSAALKSDGTVWTWGNNYYGQLGDGTTSDSSVPVLAKLPSRGGSASGIACGGAHTLAIFGGQVYAWGWNSDGQLGDSTRDNHSLPAVVSNTSGATQVSAGYIHSLALVGSSVRAWGDNEFGQIGNNSNTDALAPVTAQIVGVKQIQAGGAHSLALRTDDTLWAWGNNAYGGLGDESTSNKSVPEQVPNLTHVTAFSGGYAHTLAQGLYTAPVGTAATSGALSTSSAYATNGTIVLSWMTPLSARRAANPANYRVKVNGRPVTMTASYSTVTTSTTLTVTTGLRVRDTVTVTWSGLGTSTGAALPDGKVTMTVK